MIVILIIIKLYLGFDASYTHDTVQPCITFCKCDIISSMDSEKNISTRIMPISPQPHHYKRIVVIIAAIFIVGILAALVYQIFFSPSSRLYYNSAKEQVLLEQYNNEKMANLSEQIKTLQAGMKPAKPLTEEQQKKLQASFSIKPAKPLTDAEIKDINESLQARIDAQAKIEQKAYEAWKAAQVK